MEKFDYWMIEKGFSSLITQDRANDIINRWGRQYYKIKNKVLSWEKDDIKIILDDIDIIKFKDAFLKNIDEFAEKDGAYRLQPTWESVKNLPSGWRAWDEWLVYPKPIGIRRHIGFLDWNAGIVYPLDKKAFFEKRKKDLEELKSMEEASQRQTLEMINFMNKSTEEWRSR